MENLVKNTLGSGEEISLDIIDLLQKLVGNKIKMQLGSVDNYVLKLDNLIRNLLQLSSILTKIEKLNATKQDLE